MTLEEYIRDNFEALSGAHITVAGNLARSHGIRAKDATVQFAWNMELERRAKTKQPRRRVKARAAA